MPVLPRLISYCTRFKEDESGATAIEYGLFAALISAVIVVTVSALGTDVHTGFTTIKQALNPTTP